MNIKSRLYMSAGISVILVVILLSLVLVISGRIAERTMKHNILDDVRGGILELDILTYDYLLHREERMEQQWHAKYNSLTEILDEAAKVELTSIRTDYASLADLFTKITERSQKTQKLIQEGASQEKIDAAIALEERLVARLLITSHSIFTAASILAEESQAEVMAFQRLSTILTLSLMIILAIAVTTASLLVARSIAEPLDGLIKGAEIIGKGDLEYKVEVKSKDELGELAAAFNKMTENLKKITASRDELDREITERKRAEARLLKSNTELAAVNKELESFSYSVSHDLRAPLRAMNGFSKIMLEDYTGKLDSKGKDSLNRIRNASQRMAQLIDDLLGLSRVTRREIKLERVDLTELAKSITKDLEKTKPERRAEFLIQEGVIANGDAHLLAVVLKNLLENSWKFTSKHSSVKIEFGITKIEDQEAYFVRDNGVGFDMAYADKLFGSFQRLHSDKEFAGTGIGLATVKRIITRHGGSIWAESEVGKGATFYFKLSS